MAGTTRLELATSAVTGSVARFYNNLQDRGDCQTTRKSYKTSHIVGWVVGRKQSMDSETTSISQNSVSGPRTALVQLPDESESGQWNGLSISRMWLTGPGMILS